MNELSQLKAPEGSRRKRKRIGRGPGSGTGKTAGRGQKGQKARAGAKTFPGFEGGQMPLQRRLPKRGFAPLNKKVWALVNVADLGHFEAGTEVTPELLVAEGLVRKAGIAVKILGDGELAVSLKVSAHHFSKTAEAKITGCGGSIEVIGG